VLRLRQAFVLVAGRRIDALPEAERFALHRNAEAELPALLLLLPADQELGALLVRWRDGADPLCHPRPPCDGNTLQSLLNLKAGPQLGELLMHLSQERAFGRLAADAGIDAVVAAAQAWPPLA